MGGTDMEANLVPFGLQLALASVMFPHGAQKVLGLIIGGAGAWSLDALVAQWGKAS